MCMYIYLYLYSIYTPTPNPEPESPIPEARPDPEDSALLTRSRTQRPGSFRTIVRVMIPGSAATRRISPGSFTIRG